MQKRNEMQNLHIQFYITCIDVPDTMLVYTGSPTATGTGTLQLILLDVNDNGPFLEVQEAIMCLKSPDPLTINIIDRDEKPFTSPFTAEINREARDNWTVAVLNDRKYTTKLEQIFISECSLKWSSFDDNPYSQNKSCPAMNQIFCTVNTPWKGQFCLILQKHRKK